MTLLSLSILLLCTLRISNLFESMEKHATNGVILKANCYRLTWKKLNKDNFTDDLILHFAKYRNASS